MPRPLRKRTIYQLPPCRRFIADYDKDIPDGRKPELIRLTLDEAEAIRLIDEEGLSQEECAKRLHVSRTTSQNIIQNAHRKVADALVNGKSIEIAGGNVDYSDDAEFGCLHWRMVSEDRIGGISDRNETQDMTIAVTYQKENGTIFQHFGRTEYFKVYRIKDGKISGSEVVSTNGQGHGALAGVLNNLGADVLICGGIGGGARMALKETGIRLYGGCSGSADQAAGDFLAGKLAYQEDVRCEHHEGHHRESCGQHGKQEW